MLHCVVVPQFWSWTDSRWLTVLVLYKCSSSYSNGWWAELISKRQDGSRVYVMLHPLCQARLAQHRGEKGTNKQMNEGNKGTDSFQSGWLPGCDIAHVEILQLCWDAAGHKSRVIQSSSAKLWACVENNKKGMILIHGSTPCLRRLYNTQLRWSIQRRQLSLLWNELPDN